MKARHFLPLCASIFATAFAQDSPPSYQENCSITPLAQPNKSNRVVDFFFDAAFIYWTARQDGLAYAIEGADFNLVNFDTQRGPIHEPDWDFEPGFKVGAGLKMEHDGWDVYANYTWLHSSASDSITDPGNFLPTLQNGAFILFNIIPNPPGGGGFQSASETWKHHFNVIDLELGRDYYISQYLTLRPHFGFKGTWQEQDVRIRYSFVDTNQFRAHQHQDSWGIGIRTGLNACWFFIPSFGLYGDFAISGLWSGFNNSRKDDRVFPDQSMLNILDTHEVTHSVKPVIEFGLGLRYQLLYNDDDYRFLIQAGWEEQIWMDNNHLIDFAQYGNKGTLSLQGFTLKVRFDF